MTKPAQYLTAYDEQLRTDAETPSATGVRRLGPLRLVTFAGGRGFITYRDLAGLDAQAIRDLVASALDHYQVDPNITRVEWKTRGHDLAPGLHEALIAHGFERGETESIMIGPLEALCQDVELTLVETDEVLERSGEIDGGLFIQDLLSHRGHSPAGRPSWGRQIQHRLAHRTAGGRRRQPDGLSRYRPARYVLSRSRG